MVAQQIQDDDLRMNQSMASHGAEHIMALKSQNINVMTHCNTGGLATAGAGTALGVIRQLHNNGVLRQVFADETRPWFQGSRLTAWSCNRALT